MNKHKHLNLEARILIETLLNEHHSFKSIARQLGKDCTTISKEDESPYLFRENRRFRQIFQRLPCGFPSSVFPSEDLPALYLLQ